MIDRDRRSRARRRRPGSTPAQGARRADCGSRAAREGPDNADRVRPRPTRTRLTLERREFDAFDQRVKALQGCDCRSGERHGSARRQRPAATADDAASGSAVKADRAINANAETLSASRRPRYGPRVAGCRWTSWQSARPRGYDNLQAESAGPRGVPQGDPGVLPVAPAAVSSCAIGWRPIARALEAFLERTTAFSAGHAGARREDGGDTEQARHRGRRETRRRPTLRSLADDLERQMARIASPAADRRARRGAARRSRCRWPLTWTGSWRSRSRAAPKSRRCDSQIDGVAIAGGRRAAEARAVSVLQSTLLPLTSRCPRCRRDRGGARARRGHAEGRSGARGTGEASGRNAGAEPHGSPRSRGTP